MIEVLATKILTDEIASIIVGKIKESHDITWSE